MGLPSLHVQSKIDGGISPGATAVCLSAGVQWAAGLAHSISIGDELLVPALLYFTLRPHQA